MINNTHKRIDMKSIIEEHYTTTTSFKEIQKITGFSSSGIANIIERFKIKPKIDKEYILLDGFQKKIKISKFEYIKEAIKNENYTIAEIRKVVEFDYQFTHRIINFILHGKAKPKLTIIQDTINDRSKAEFSFLKNGIEYFDVDAFSKLMN